MKNLNNPLQEQAHGFIIFKPSVVWDDLLEETYETSSLDLTYSNKFWRRGALNYIKLVYMLEGSAALRFLLENESDFDFVDTVRDWVNYSESNFNI